MLLLLSGDVEVNPGPNPKVKVDAPSEILSQILERQDAIAKDIADIKAQQKRVDERMANIDGKLSLINENQSAVDKALQQIHTRLDKIENVADQIMPLQTKISETTDRVYELEKDICSIACKLDDLENRSRRNNLIVYGIKESDQESQEALRRRVCNDIFKDVLQLKIESIERCHRLGERRTNKDRPVILRVVDYKEKMLVLQNAYKFKGSNYSVGEDFSKRVREIRRNLWLSSTEERKSGENVKLRYDKLYVDSVAYVWNHKTQQREQLQSKAQNRPRE